MSERSVDLVRSIARTLDDIWDSVIGGRPLERVLDIVQSLAPANVARKLGLPAPGDFPDKVAQELENALKTGRIPSPLDLIKKR